MIGLVPSKWASGIWEAASVESWPRRICLSFNFTAIIGRTLYFHFNFGCLVQQLIKNKTVFIQAHNIPLHSITVLVFVVTLVDFDKYWIWNEQASLHSISGPWSGQAKNKVQDFQLNSKKGCSHLQPARLRIWLPPKDSIVSQFNDWNVFSRLLSLNIVAKCQYFYKEQNPWT